MRSMLYVQAEEGMPSSAFFIAPIRLYLREKRIQSIANTSIAKSISIHKKCTL